MSAADRRPTDHEVARAIASADDLDLERLKRELASRLGIGRRSRAFLRAWCEEVPAAVAARAAAAGPRGAPAFAAALARLQENR